MDNVKFEAATATDAGKAATAALKAAKPADDAKAELERVAKVAQSDLERGVYGEGPFTVVLVAGEDGTVGFAVNPEGDH